MPLDGRLLAKARERLAGIREGNASEQERRTQEVYRRCPQIKDIDEQLRRLFARLVRVTVSTDAGRQREIAEINAQVSQLRSRRTQLLHSYGYRDDYLDDIYSCSKCCDRGYDRQGRPCRCLLDIYGQEQANELSSMAKLDNCDFGHFDLSYYSSEPDPVMGISPRANMTMVLSTCRDYAQDFGSDSPNLLFRGGTGLGKTMLSACIARAVAVSGHSVVYDTAVSAFEAFEAQKFSRDSALADGASAKVQRMLSCDLMILDDLGTEMTTSFTQSALYTLVNTRLNEGRKTIISTNLSPEDMQGRYNSQILSRLGEYITLPFFGKDIRVIKRERRFA